MGVVNKVLRLKHKQDLHLPNYNDTIHLHDGESFHIVNDVVYMGGYPVPGPMQKPMYDWLNDNPTLFVEDTRNF
tara:strand:+ start:144112 stop:144333 length:222 start_codon:yes stop_codon:yes gene_type:complete